MLKKIIILFFSTVFVLFSGCGGGGQTPDLSENVDIEIVTGNGAETGPTAEPAPETEAVKYNDYSISMDIDPDTRDISGTQRVIYKNRTGGPINRIYFNLYLNSYRSDSDYLTRLEQDSGGVWNGEPDYGYMRILSARVNNSDADYSVDGTLLTVNFKEALPAESDTEIILTFEAHVPAINARTGANGRALWLGSFFPVLAVYDDDGWHTGPYYPVGSPFYTNISNYSVKISTPVGYTVAATGEESSYETGDRRITTVNARFVREFALAVSDSYRLETLKTDSGVYINLYYYSDIDSDVFLEYARRSLQYYGYMLGGYPYSSIDIVETGYYQTGATYPQIIFLNMGSSEEDVLLDMSKRIGRQWFYDIIGSNQVKEPWLSNGITEFLTRSRNTFDITADITAQMDRLYAETAEWLSGMENGAMTADLGAYKTQADYEAVQIHRACLMVYALKLKMGEDKFHDFLNAYCAEHWFTIVTGAKFIKTAEEIYGGDLTEFFEGWMEGNEMPELILKQVP